VTRLVLCRACKRFVKPSEVTCPFCAGPARDLAVLHQAQLADDRRVAEEAVRLLRELGEDVEGLIPEGWRR
jgi:hypothetical protein